MDMLNNPISLPFVRVHTCLFVYDVPVHPLLFLLLSIMTTRKITETIDNIKQRLHSTSDDDAIPLMQHAHSAPTPQTTAKHVKQSSHGKFSL